MNHCSGTPERLRCRRSRWELVVWKKELVSTGQLDSAWQLYPVSPSHAQSVQAFSIKNETHRGSEWGGAPGCEEAGWVRHWERRLNGSPHPRPWSEPVRPHLAKAHNGNSPVCAPSACFFDSTVAVDSWWHLISTFLLKSTNHEVGDMSDVFSSISQHQHSAWQGGHSDDW